ncbi:hypothetical protein BRETT_005270 [Brettanomyces bruxellensis]|uniref:RNA helicase n=1 Tax=Dekkera bruxellensis TaxID=5007 RepID=A0A871R3I4_DEKBR|nr:uncharacterized protein BRETT_005270 [Brettanomyces bruxellensis]QOU18208.1 hypothetical protein BRETT_005270 [Brettanomyces bruxellensis]
MENIKEGEIHRGVVTSIKPYGAFVALGEGENSRDDDKHRNGRYGHKRSGLCHISQMVSGRRLEDPREVVSVGDRVWVEVTEVRGDGKISLSMKNVDQATGKETRGVSGPAEHTRKRKTRVDAWEMTQLRQAYGVKRTKMDFSAEDEDPYAEVDEESSEGGEDEEGQEVEIQLNQELPPFLAGSARELRGHTGQNEPEKAVRVSDESLQRLAEKGSRFLAETRKEKVEKRRAAERSRRERERGEDEEDPMGMENIEERLKESTKDFKESTKDPKESSKGSTKNLKESTKDFKDTPSAVDQWKTESSLQQCGFPTLKSIRQQRESLPIFKVRSQLMRQVAENSMLVVVGETGSGKSTQITQYLAEEGYGTHGMIACTQPRRVAAKSVAQRVAEEVGCSIGQEVGYQIRFEDCTSSKTVIKYMTDGMLEREVLVDPDMGRYSVIMLDEAHERTVATDVLFALLREAVRRRKGGLRVIVTSATLDSGKFSRYFDGCPVFHIAGRAYPVKILHSRQPEPDYVAAAIDTVVQIHVNNAAGDILVFLTGREEIEACCEAIVQKMAVLRNADRGIGELLVLPVYSAMPSEMQSRIFEPTPRGKRKVVVATNIAETSITIDGILYVVDPGFVKVNAYDSRLGMDRLAVEPVSRAQADQRAGRAGRTGPGVCYRLYTRRAYDHDMCPAPVPEILRHNLATTALVLKALGVAHVLHFPFMDPPPRQALLAALHELYILGAVSPRGSITPPGKAMARFPMDPLLSRALLQSLRLGCSRDVIVIIAMISVPDVFLRPRDHRVQADRARRQFDHPSGDHLTLLTVYRRWQDANYSRAWCTSHYLHWKSLHRAREVVRQLTGMVGASSLSSSSSLSTPSPPTILKAFLSGFFKNCAKRSPNDSFHTLAENTPVHIHPSSALYRKPGLNYLLYHSLILTNMEYMHCVSKIDPSWLLQCAPKFYSPAKHGQLSLAKRTEKISPLWNKFDPNQSWRLSRGRR